MPDSINEEMEDEFIHHAIELLGVAAGILPLVLAWLQEMEAEIEVKVYQAGIFTAGSTPSQVRLNSLLRTVNYTIEEAFAGLTKELTNHLIEIVRWNGDRLPKLMDNVVSLENAFTGALTPKQIEKIATTSLVEGLPSSRWWDRQEQRTKDLFEAQVRLGMALGEDNDQIIARVLGKRTGWTTVTDSKGRKKRIGTYSGGALNVTRREAQALIITSVAKVSNETQWAVFKDNADILKGVRAVVTLDTRTSELCRARSGGAWDFEGNPLPMSRISIPFPGPPPWHFRCRTILVPVVKSWAELSEDLGHDALPEFPESTQSSMDGQVPNSLNYEDWFRKKVAANGDTWGERIMGKGKYALWKAGKLGMADMVEASGRSITLRELRERYGMAK